MVAILSLVVAAIAVFLTPIASWAIAKKQIDSAERVAHRQVIAPMRQAWIDHLRSLLAEVLSSAHHYFVAGYEDRTDKEYRRVTAVVEEIDLMLNPTEPEHRALMVSIRELVGIVERGDSEDGRFADLHKRATSQAKGVLKIEWNRTKDIEHL